MNSVKDTEYGAYYKRYIANVATDDISGALNEGLKDITAFYQSIPAEKQEYRYESGKWTPKEILLHLIDCERVFMYRAMQIARSNDANLAGFDQDEFVFNSNANAISMDNLINEYKTVRAASISFIENCDAKTLVKMGIASNSPLSVRAAAYITRGHEIHHTNVIKERYL